MAPSRMRDRRRTVSERVTILLVTRYVATLGIVRVVLESDLDDGELVV